MPFLYFVVRPKCKNSDFVYAKFGNTSNLTKRLKDYGPGTFASVEYDSKISDNTPLDNYINNNVLHKNGSTSVVDFWHNDKSVRKTDWFTMQTCSADRVLSYMENVKSLYNNEDYRQFTMHLLGNILGRLEEKHIQNPSTIQNNLQVSSTNVKTSAQCYMGEIYRRREPAEVPTRLKELVVDADCAGCTSDDSTAFLTANFVEGGIMPIKDMIAHPDWKQKYRHQLKTKRVHMCIWCKLQAQKECCDKYCSEDRIKVTMVVGWHQDEDA